MVVFGDVDVDVDVDLPCLPVPCSQEDLATRLWKRIQDSSTLQRAKAVHSRIAESDPIDKVCVRLATCSASTLQRN